MSWGAKEKWKRKPSTPTTVGKGVGGDRVQVSREETTGGNGSPSHAVSQRNDITFLVANEENVLERSP